MIESNILVVDDEFEITDTISSYLRSCFKVKVFCALSGEEALDVIKKNHISLMVSDFNMPKGNGLWLVNEIHRNKLSLLIIIFSSELNLEIPSLTKINSQNVVIAKPDLVSLVEKVREMGIVSELHANPSIPEIGTNDLL